jgi:hypothetical protein
MNNDTQHNTDEIRAEAHAVALDVLRLPEWQTCLEDMRHQGIDYGSTFPTSFFEERLRTKRDTMRFGIAMYRIRTKLLEDGYYLSGRGAKGERFEIVPAAANAKVMENMQAEAARALAKGLILGTNTRIDLLTDAERRKHESMLEKLAVRSALFSRRVPTLKKALVAITDKAA